MTSQFKEYGRSEQNAFISTTFNIFRSADRGQTWKQVKQQSNAVFGIVDYKDTLFTMRTLLGFQAVVTADNYRVNDGLTWQRYTGWNQIFDIHFPSLTPLFLINPVVASDGATYKINKAFLDGPAATTGVFETSGVIPATRRRIDLP